MRNVLKAKGKNSLEIQEGRAENIEERIIQLIRHEVENHKRSEQKENNDEREETKDSCVESSSSH